MPSSRRRHRIELDAELYTQLTELAAREGYPVSRFTDKLLYFALDRYILARQRGQHPFAGGWAQMPLPRDGQVDAAKLR